MSGTLQRVFIFNFNCLIIVDVTMLSDLYNPKKKDMDHQKRQKERERDVCTEEGRNGSRGEREPKME